MSDLSRRNWLALTAAAAAQGTATASITKDKAKLIAALRGVHNFMVTPFLGSKELDIDGLRKNVAYHAAGAPRNMTIVVGGGLGELFTMDADEQREIARAAVAGAMGRLPVVVGAGGGYRLAMRMARNAADANVDAILLFSPPYGSESAEGAYQYFRDVAKSVSIGVIAYPRGNKPIGPPY